MDVPKSISFEHADQLLQGLTTLSPRRLERLLKRTRNIKVRRLFYWFAERNNFPWFQKLPSPDTLDDLGLGSGKRITVSGTPSLPADGRVMVIGQILDSQSVNAVLVESLP